MIRSSHGDILLLHFPFSDLCSFKKRPALVLTTSEYGALHTDIVLVALTSQRQADEQWYLPWWREAGLLKPTWLKPLIATLEFRVIERRLGRLPSSDWPTVGHLLRGIIAADFLS